MSAAERASLKLNISLDTVDTWLPLMPNSDHANFARHGVPAFRLVAGFNKPTSRVNNILSAGDVPHVVQEAELRQALAVTCALGYTALRKSETDLNRLALRDGPV